MTASKNSILIEGVDFTFNNKGDMVLTKSYLLARGHCCQSGCLNCPYGYADKVDPLIPSELQDNWSNEYIDDDLD